MTKEKLSSLEINLKGILDRLDSQKWTIEYLFQSLKGKGYPFLIILLCLPFCQPLQIPGFSTPFGVAIIFIGLRMLFGKKMWWPQWMLKKEISPKLLKSVIEKSLWFIRVLKKVIYQRWDWICTDPIWFKIHGFFISLMGFYLALPLPIPFSNLLAAWALLLIGLGLIEGDGFFVLLGYMMGFLAMFVLIYLIIWVRAWAVS